MPCQIFCEPSTFLAQNESPKLEGEMGKDVSLSKFNLQVHLMGLGSN